MAPKGGDDPEGTRTRSSQQRPSQSGESTARHPTTDEFSEGKARLIVEQLLERDILEMDADTPVLHHVPTGYTFESNEALAHFHTGWQNGRESHGIADE